MISVTEGVAVRDRRGLAALICLLLAVSAAWAGTTSYVYDARGRLISATSASALTTSYTYDAAGNRTQTVTQAGVPVANAVAVTVTADSTNNPVTLNVTGSYTSVAVPSPGASHGTATASGTTITYTPNSGYAGPDSFTYTATNSSGTSGPASVQVAVAPLAANVMTTVAFDSSANPVPVSVVGSYTNVGVASLPSHGSASASGTSLSYTPTSGYSGADSFLYTASNAVATSPSATASITVNPQTPVANPVSATVYAYTSNNNIPLTITGGAPTSVAVATGPSHGTATASGTMISYTPTSGYTGSDSFTYTASNAGGTSPAATASITVKGLTVVASAPLNCPPTGSYYACATSTTSSYTFTGSTITLTILGGTGAGNYTYAWNANGDSSGTWATGQTTASVTPSVTQVLIGDPTTIANYNCTVTDHGAGGVQATSNSIQFEYTRN